MVGLPPSLAMTTPPRDFLRGGVRAQVCQKEIEMNAQFSLIKILVVAFAVIGLLAVLSVLSMTFMHSGMMMSFRNMVATCGNMMSGRP